jgi:hypothetical protein
MTEKWLFDSLEQKELLPKSDYHYSQEHEKIIRLSDSQSTDMHNQFISPSFPPQLRIQDDNSSLKDEDDENFTQRDTLKDRGITRSQEIIGTVMFNKLKNLLVKKGLQDYSKVNIQIIVQAMTNLWKQTEKRVEDWCKYAKVRGIPVPDNFPSDCVRMANDSRFKEVGFQKFIDDAKKHSTELFLLIHDECHWGIGKKPIKIKDSPEQEEVELDIEEDDPFQAISRLLIKLPKNVIVIHISATPISLTLTQSIKDNPENVVNWIEEMEKNSELKTLCKDYVSYKDLTYRSPITNLVPDEVMTEWKNAFSAIGAPILRTDSAKACIFLNNTNPQCMILLNPPLR